MVLILGIFMERRVKAGEKRKRIVVFVLAALFAVLQIAGSRISVYYNTTVHRSNFAQYIGASGIRCVIWYFLFFAVLYVGIGQFFTLLEKTEDSPAEKSDDEKGNLILWIIFSILLFLCWLPCYTASYPGFYNYDAFSQVPQALYEEVPYSAHHPLLHTLLMGKIIAFGYHHGTDLNSGIALHSVFQMLVCAVSLSFVLCYIRKVVRLRWMTMLSFCYFAFFPPVPMFAMSTTKDTLFSVLLLFVVIFLHDMCQDMSAFFHSGWRIFVFWGTVLLMCLFRKNGVYAFLCLVPFFVLLQRRYAKQVLVLCCVIIFSYFIADKCLIRMLNAERGSTEEMLSVPMQQVARVYNDYGKAAFSEEELSLIYAGISEEDLLGYNPFLSDSIKNYFDYSVIQNNRLTFFKLWIEKGIRYPKTYIRAFLDNTYQAWYPWTSIIKKPGDIQTDYFEMDMCAGGYRDSKMPGLLQFYNKIATEFYYQKIPGLRLLFSPGAMLWVAIFTFGYALYRKKYPVMISGLLILFYCLTVLAGPVSLVRYYLILFYAFPVCIGYCLENSKHS